jgi:hypothetical protein
VPDHVQRPLEGRFLVLEPDLDQLERRDHEGLGCACHGASEGGEGEGVLLLAVVGEYRAPVSCESSEHIEHHAATKQGGEQTRDTPLAPTAARQYGFFAAISTRHDDSHFTARFGASSISGGTIPRYSLPALNRISETFLSREKTTHPSVATMLRKVCTMPMPPLPVSSCWRVLTTSRGYRSYTGEDERNAAVSRGRLEHGRGKSVTHSPAIAPAAKV